MYKLLDKLFIDWTDLQLVTPKRARIISAYLTLFWALMLPVALFTGLTKILTFLALISIYANLAGHAAQWQASRVEERQERQEKAG